MSTQTQDSQNLAGGPAVVVPDKHTAIDWRRWLVIIAIAFVVVSAVRVVTGAHDMDSSGLLAAAIGLAVPIGLAGLGGLWSERAGVVNIGLEGMMILGTWGGAFAAWKWGPWVGLLGAILFGMVGGAVHALATVIFGVDHIVSGVAINLLGAGAAAYLATRVFLPVSGSPTQSPYVKQPPTITIQSLSDSLGTLENHHWFLISDLAALLRALVTQLSVVTILAVLLFVFSWWFLWRTKYGLRLRSCGEAPQAAETLGINVYRYKFMAVVISGGFAGLAGGFLALVQANLYRDGQTGGRGYIGLAAMIFGNWRPGGLAAGSLLFGYTDGVQLRGGGKSIHAFLLPLAIGLILWAAWLLYRRRSGLSVRGQVVKLVIGLIVLAWFAVTQDFPGELTGMLPYVTTLLVLVFAAQRLRMPAADGLIYRKGEAK